jgi:hypothetical protein
MKLRRRWEGIVEKDLREVDNPHGGDEKRIQNIQKT